jgi:hypothetical protein
MGHLVRCTNLLQSALSFYGYGVREKLSLGPEANSSGAYEITETLILLSSQIGDL